MADTVQVTGIPELEKALKKSYTQAVAAIRAQLAESGLQLETETKRRLTDDGDVDTGGTRASIHYQAADEGMTAEVHAGGAAAVIEFGSAPHMPPIEPLEAWAQRHGMPAGTGLVIAQAIARRGTPPRPFILPAFAQVSSRFPKDLAARLNRLLASLSE